MDGICGMAGECEARLPVCLAKLYSLVAARLMCGRCWHVPAGRRKRRTGAVAMTMQTVGVDETGDGPEVQFMIVAMASLISVRSGGPRRPGTLLPSMVGCRSGEKAV